MSFDKLLLHLNIQHIYKMLLMILKVKSALNPILLHTNPEPKAKYNLISDVTD